MRQRLADLDVEIVSAERPKFAAPILLLHGLWVDSWIWRSFAGYLAHRGWSSYLLSWRAAARTIGELKSLVERCADEVDGAPVLIGHDIGATVALQIERAGAVAALAPLPVGEAARRLPPFSGFRAHLARLRGGMVSLTRKQAAEVLGFDARDALEPEPRTWIDDLAALSPPKESATPPPRLLLAGGADPCLPIPEAETLADASGAELRIYPDASHALPVGAGWERRVGDVHRWLVHTLGAPLLLLRGDEDLQEE